GGDLGPVLQDERLDELGVRVGDQRADVAELASAAVADGPAADVLPGVLQPPAVVVRQDEPRHGDTSRSSVPVREGGISPWSITKPPSESRPGSIIPSSRLIRKPSSRLRS